MAGDEGARKKRRRSEAKKKAIRATPRAAEALHAYQSVGALIESVGIDIISTQWTSEEFREVVRTMGEPESERMRNLVKETLRRIRNRESASESRKRAKRRLEEALDAHEELQNHVDELTELLAEEKKRTEELRESNESLSGRLKTERELAEELVKENERLKDELDVIKKLQDSERLEFASRFGGLVGQPAGPRMVGEEEVEEPHEPEDSPEPATPADESVVEVAKSPESLAMSSDSVEEHEACAPAVCRAVRVISFPSHIRLCCDLEAEKSQNADELCTKYINEGWISEAASGSPVGPSSE